MQWGAGAGAGSPGCTGCQMPGWVVEGGSFSRALLLLGGLESTSLLGLASTSKGLKSLGLVELEDRFYPVTGPESLERA